MIVLPGDPSEYVEEPPGSRQFQRYVDGKPVGPPTWVREGVEFADIFERRKQEIKRTIPKSVIVSRLIEAGKISAAFQALNSKPEAWARWVASDRPAINYDDPDAIALLKAIGADPEKILAP